MIDKFKETFREEAYELLGTLEHDVLELEDNSEDPELLASLFRAMHTIKGSAAMFGYSRISAFTHEIESIMDDVRTGKVLVTRKFIDLTLEAKDQIRELLEDEVGADEAKAEKILDGFRRLTHSAAAEVAPEPTPVAADVEREENPEGEVTYRITFEPKEDIFLSGTKPILLLQELTELGEYTSICHVSSIPDLDGLDPERAYVSWDFFLTTEYAYNTIRDVFIFVESDSKVSIEMIDDLSAISEDQEYKRLGEILVERGVTQEESIVGALNRQKRLGQVLVDEKVVSESDLNTALEEQNHVRRTRVKQYVSESASIRVSSEKLDSLVDLVGELVTIQARVSQLANDAEDTRLAAASEQLERLSSELRENTMSLRMVPIGSTFSKFRRLVRDLSADLGKQVEMETRGAETELDKTVIERLNDPLVHLIRNCIDHGIELPAERRASGKDECGTVRLSAQHSGASVLISIADDGAGLDRERIYRKALERGILSPDEEVTEQGIYHCIFAPGFSTAGEVTSVSGRGVGMDVVRRQIETLRGSVDIRNTPGKGTEIVLTLPLTLAIIEGLLIRIDGDSFVVPLSSVEACIELTAKERDRLGSKRIVDYRGRLLPFVRIRDLFDFASELPEIEQIVVVETQDGPFGLVVDQVIGEHQTVIKSLGRLYAEVECISGATILGDGAVALILDLEKIAGLASSGRKQSRDGSNRSA
jgi:two-component system, chemotaxis family, sensor kinase CheA